MLNFFKTPTKSFKKPNILNFKEVIATSEAYSERMGKMERLTRITLRTIADLVENPKEGVRFIGKGIVRTSWEAVSYLRIQTPEEDIVLKSRRTQGMNRIEFLNYVDEVLSHEGLYLTCAGYRAGKWKGFFPHVLKGLFYKGERETIEWVEDSPETEAVSEGE